MLSRLLASETLNNRLFVSIICAFWKYQFCLWKCVAYMKPRASKVYFNALFRQNATTWIKLLYTGLIYKSVRAIAKKVVKCCWYATFCKYWMIALYQALYQAPMIMICTESFIRLITLLNQGYTTWSYWGCVNLDQDIFKMLLTSNILSKGVVWNVQEA